VIMKIASHKSWCQKNNADNQKMQTMQLAVRFAEQSLRTGLKQRTSTVLDIEGCAYVTNQQGIVAMPCTADSVAYVNGAT